jgi:hypothetical protein
LRPFGIIYGRLIYFAVIWYIFSRFGMFAPRKIWQPWNRPPKKDLQLGFNRIRPFVNGFENLATIGYAVMGVSLALNIPCQK